MMKKRAIKDAHKAWWFLYNHPKFSVPDRIEVTPASASELETAGYLVSRDKGGSCYRYFRHARIRSVERNLDIHYTKVDKVKGGKVNKDKTKNVFIECWLEFGPLNYGYTYSGSEKSLADWDNETTLQSQHDYKLDTGGATFDEALIKLAKLVLKHYGDYPVGIDRTYYCGKPRCADCKDSTEWVSSANTKS